MYFMNEDDLGGYSTTGNNVLGTYQIGAGVESLTSWILGMAWRAW